MDQVYGNLFSPPSYITSHVQHLLSGDITYNKLIVQHYKDYAKNPEAEGMLQIYWRLKET